MAYRESSMRVDAIGDNGRSYGIFQIRARLHNVPVSKCRNVEFATRWTIRRIKSFGNVWKGVTRHCGKGPSARRYAREVRKIARGITK